MLIDTHAHVNFNAFKNNADEVIRRSLNNNVWMINVGSQYTTSKRAVELAEKYPEGVYAAIGLHPIHLAEGIFRAKLDKEEIAFQTQNEDFSYEKYKNLAKSKKVVAIGEIGLDYKVGQFNPSIGLRINAELSRSIKEIQRPVLCKQLDLARELNLPVIFHCRSAHDDLIEILNTKYKILNTRGVVHCFTGTWEQAQKYLEMGLYLGFNGIIFKLNLDEIISKTPLDKILIETDCPYLTPSPAVALAKVGRNEPLFVKYVAEKIAKIKELNYKEISQVTTENAEKLFKI